MLVILSLWNRESSAFWGDGSTDPASGLNVASGYDVNTITSMSGVVVSPPERKGRGQHTEMSVSAARGTVTVVLGPWWYWEKQTITIAKNQELTITGSLAQGKDGALYLFAQRLENRSNGEAVTLRSESGKPLWSAGGRGNGIRGGRR